MKEAFELANLSLQFEGLSETICSGRDLQPAAASLQTGGMPGNETTELLHRADVDPAQVYLVESWKSKQDPVGGNEEVGRAILGLSTILPPKPDQRKDVAEYYQKIASTLKHAVGLLKKGETPHGDCGKLDAYADQLPSKVKDFIPEFAADRLKAKMKEAHNVENLALVLGQDENQKERLESLERAAGYFKASADAVLASP